MWPLEKPRVCVVFRVLMHTGYGRALVGKHLRGRPRSRDVPPSVGVIVPLLAAATWLLLSFQSHDFVGLHACYGALRAVVHTCVLDMTNLESYYRSTTDRGRMNESTTSRERLSLQPFGYGLCHHIN